MGIKVGRKGRAEARTDFTGPGLGQGLAAGQSRWLLFAEKSPALPRACGSTGLNFSVVMTWGLLLRPSVYVS